MSMISKIYGSTQYMRGLYAKSVMPKREPVLIWVRDRYEVHFSYSIHKSLKKNGFLYDPKNHCWFTADPYKARKALKYADRLASGKLTHLPKKPKTSDT